MGFFGFQRIAEGYANHRPYFHPLVIKEIRDQLNLHKKVHHALDVGCGAGLSTKALLDIAETVKGIDKDKEMIAAAKTHQTKQVTYIHAAAEKLPFKALTFDIITVSGAINWIDRAQFLPEAGRVLRQQGWLIIYDNFITNQMLENQEYMHWYNDQYLIRYPKPPRNETLMTDEEAGRYDFQFIRSEDYSNELHLSYEQFIEYMLTQSNIIRAVDIGYERLSEVRQWMETTLEPIIPRPIGTFICKGYVWYLRSHLQARNTI